MNGTRLIGGGMVGANPGPGWHLIKASWRATPGAVPGRFRLAPAWG